MKKYLKPQFEIVRYITEDVLKTSGEVFPSVPPIQEIDGEDD